MSVDIGQKYKTHENLAIITRKQINYPLAVYASLEVTITNSAQIICLLSGLNLQM